PCADEFVGLVDATVQELEAQPLGPRLLKQALCFGPRFLDVGPEPGNLLQLFFARRQRRSRKDDTADGAYVGDLGERRRPVPAVDRQAQRASHPGVVERLFLVVGLHQAAAVPIAFLHRDLVTERLDDLVTRRGRQPTKLHCRAVAAYRLDTYRLLIGVDA